MLLPLFILSGLSLRAEAILERRLTLEFKNTELKTALDQVAEEGDFLWSYNARIIDGKSRVSLRADNWSVREILLELLGDAYQFKPNGNYLILKKRKRPSDELSGYLKDPNTGERISNATIYDRKTLRTTQSDADGYYSLKVRNESEVVVSKLAYKDTVLHVESMGSRYHAIDLHYDSVSVVPGHTTLRKEVREAGLEIEQFFKATLDQVVQANVRDSFHRRGQVSVLPGIGTNKGLSSQVTNDWSLNVLAGVSRGNEIFEVASLANFTQEYLEGFQVAGLFNILHGSARGVQIAGLFNETAGTLSGVQISGLVNHASETRGLGIQIAGVVNISGSSRSTAQISGLFNTAEVSEGIQISGLVNHAWRMHGVQIGLINNCNDLHGVQIGLINRAGGRVMPLINWKTLSWKKKPKVL